MHICVAAHVVAASIACQAGVHSQKQFDEPMTGSERLNKLLAIGSASRQEPMLSSQVVRDHHNSSSVVSNASLASGSPQATSDGERLNKLLAIGHTSSHEPTVSGQVVRDRQNSVAASNTSMADSLSQAALDNVEPEQRLDERLGDNIEPVGSSTLDDASISLSCSKQLGAINTVDGNAKLKTICQREKTLAKKYVDPFDVSRSQTRANESAALPDCQFLLAMLSSSVTVPINATQAWSASAIDAVCKAYGKPLLQMLKEDAFRLRFTHHGLQPKDFVFGTLLICMLSSMAGSVYMFVRPRERISGNSRIGAVAVAPITKAATPQAGNRYTSLPLGGAGGGEVADGI